MQISALSSFSSPTNDPQEPQKPKAAPVLTSAPSPKAHSVSTSHHPAPPVRLVSLAVSAAGSAPAIVLPPGKRPEPPRPSWAPASSSRLRKRHVAMIGSFLAVVVLPFLLCCWYMVFRAQDQYASTLGFSVQRENMESAISLMSGLSSFTGSASPDTDIIYRYIYSQSLVSEIDADLDLRAIWNKAEGDFYFSIGDDSTIEDLVDYWGDMVKVNYDNTSKLIEVRVRAFTPEDAQAITQRIFDKSTEMINRLNEAALTDAVRFTEGELQKWRENLITARQAMTAFRNEYQMVDPAADAAAQMTLVSSLEQSAAQTRIELDLLKETTHATDPRVAPLQRRIQVTEEQIRLERAKLGVGTSQGSGTVMADIFADYERLRVDQEFAEASYHSARAAYEVALAEAQRQSRFLAAHIMPTLAESSRDPNRPVVLGVAGGGLLLLWMIASLLFYSMRDRR